MSKFRSLSRDEADTLWQLGNYSFEYMLPTEGRWREWGDFPHESPHQMSANYEYRIEIIADEST